MPIRQSLTFALVAFAILSCTSNDYSADIRKVGTYSDMCYNTESGDVNGMEVRIVITKAGPYAIFQASEGALSVPVVIKVNTSDDRIEFDIPETVPFGGKFKGVIKSDEMVAAIEGYTGYAANLRLKRQPSYWERDGAAKICK